MMKLNKRRDGSLTIRLAGVSCKTLCGRMRDKVIFMDDKLPCRPGENLAGVHP